MANRDLLVGDIGGTNARFAIARPDGSLSDVLVLKVGNFATFDAALRSYVEGLEAVPEVLCIASAGAIHGDRITLTNAHWSLSESALGSAFGFRAVRLINDFQAQARFAGTMPSGAGRLLKEGTAIDGAPVLTIGPGTGFGQSLFVPGSPPRVIACEGGHRLLPVRNERELQLYQRLEERFGYPPILEDALSGRGIVNLYDQCLIEAGLDPRPVEPPEITASALASPGHERDAILWFIDLLAAAAADAFLSTGARGGVAVSGGILPRFEPLLDQMDFGRLFARQGILKDYLVKVPVRMVTDPYAALRGAAAMMRDTLQSPS